MKPLKPTAMKHLMTLLFFSSILVSPLAAQTLDEMTQMKTAKEAELKALEAQAETLKDQVEALKTEVADLTEIITPYPRHEWGISGNLGFNFATYTDWLSKADANSTALTLGFAGKGHYNLLEKKYFWRNNLNLVLGWLKYDNRDDPNDDSDFKVAADELRLNSLFGYKLSEKLALSVMAEYHTAMLDGKFNDPGYLDFGAGITWTPIKDLVVVFHPLDYNFVFSRGDYDYESSFGCKIVADYKKEIIKNILWKSNLSAFVSYKGSDLSNWTWTNGLSTKTHGIGIGLDFAFRGNKQEALAEGLTDNPFQTYWILGITYALGKE